MQEAEQLDGNAAGGLLAGIFTFDVTTARATCDGCGGLRLVADLHAYDLEMGVILRCPGCGAAMIRIARLGAGYGVDLRGVTLLSVHPAG